jgi:ubiquitin carboxyl-terminal hydrolase 7
MHVNYESVRQEKFTCITLHIQNFKTIKDSIQNYVEVEEMTGDNQYDADKFGKQDAKKFIRFKKLPPVL